MKILRVFVLCCITQSSLAGVVVLNNGDRITGSIKKIWDAKVYIEPTYADEFAIDQVDIAYVESDQQFEIKLKGTKVKVLASFVGVGDDGKQIIEIDGKRTALPFGSVRELEDLEAFFDWATNIDINSTLNSGNTNNFNASLSADLMLKWGRAKNFYELLLQQEEQQDPLTGDRYKVKDRQLFRYNLNYDLSDPLFSGAMASYERDPFKGLDYRWNVLPSLGYNIWNSADRLFNLQLGVGYQSEETFTDDPSTPGVERAEVTQQDGAIAQFVLRFDYDFGAPDVRVYLNNTTTAAFYGRKNKVTQFGTGLKYNVTDLLYLNLEFLASYESEPVEGVSPEDLSFLFGFGLEFDK